AIRVATVKAAFVCAFHVAVLRIAGASPGWTVIARHTCAPPVVRGFVAWTVAIVAEAGRRAATIGTVALGFPCSATTAFISADGIVVYAAAIGIAFGVGAHIGVRFIHRKLVLASRHSIVSVAVKSAALRTASVVFKPASLALICGAAVSSAERTVVVRRAERAGIERTSGHTGSAASRSVARNDGSILNRRRRRCYSAFVVICTEEASACGRPADAVVIREASAADIGFRHMESSAIYSASTHEVLMRHNTDRACV